MDRANRIAVGIARFEYRKAMGISYIFWSTVSISFAALYSAISELGIRNSYLPLPMGLYGFLSMSVVILYIVIFYGTIINRFSKAFEIFNSVKYGIKSSHRRLLSLALAMLLSIAYYFAYELTTVLSVAFLAVLSSTLLFIFLYRPMTIMGVRPRYYDYIAWTAYIVSMSLGLMFYFLYYIMTLLWVYAGMASLLEAMEHGRH
ncbi:hypothetical protein GCM10007981_11290 [Thermocladium modestius]|uniref:Uncharacterized protein n=2 Tax=Thermocladium modestius TaxID=62609 RepID=A0A830GWB9_9CREN|nr:hypothetical protein GCM10007981_11290 [Thermocladium modestius]